MDQIPSYKKVTGDFAQSLSKDERDQLFALTKDTMNLITDRIYDPDPTTNGIDENALIDFLMKHPASTKVKFKMAFVITKFLDMICHEAHKGKKKHEVLRANILQMQQMFSRYE